ncbi:hypothetical protein PVT67_05010 [Gallaecimonas kandeliae]|nr:hypothetical protein [Gallaecimonas kandeliae]WKE66612.1 hypothetical protein PVT67_05010 [Gallaecimonas kandeliae]
MALSGRLLHYLKQEMEKAPVKPLKGEPLAGKARATDVIAK